MTILIYDVCIQLRIHACILCLYYMVHTYITHSYFCHSELIEKTHINVCMYVCRKIVRKCVSEC